MYMQCLLGRHRAYQKFTCGHLQSTVLAGSSVADQYEIEASEALDLRLWCKILGLIQPDGNNAQLCINNGRQHSSIANKQIHVSRGAELFVIVLQSKMVGRCKVGGMRPPLH